MSQRQIRIFAIVLASIMVLALVVIVDFEYPRMGLIRIDAVDQVLVDLRAGMK